MRFLLVNPWIADVAAYNFWLRPLGLFMLSQWLWERGAQTVIVDCLSPAPAPGKFPRKVVEKPEPLRNFPRKFARYGISEEEFRARVKMVGPCDGILVTSAMSYWYPGVQWAISRLRELLPNVPIVLGGVYPTLWPEHAREFSGADYVLPGPLERVAPYLCSIFGLSHEPIRDKRPWYELGFHDGASYGALRTAYGCPFKCSYCASRRLSPEFSPRDVDDILREIFALSQMGVKDITFYDDALLVDFSKRLKPVLDEVVKKRLPVRFHTPNGLHARLIDEEVAEYLSRAGFSTIRVSLETVDPARQKETGAKVSSDHVEKAIRLLRRAGIPASSIGVYLLMGLPDQPLEEVREGVSFVRSLGIRPYLSEFSPIPGTPEWEKLVSRRVIPGDIDPLLTNNTIFFRLYSGYPMDEVRRLLEESRKAL